MPSKRMLRLMLIPEYRKRRSTTITRNSFYNVYTDKENNDRPKVAELAVIFHILEEIADSHRNLRRKTEQKAYKKAVSF
ncbi:hypothetical protein OESDEN_07345 [Oesophagostomum dentatum]|uniref:Uncharacterized protein n=1 Tax=Oesophagostomum dentatum TaxID=61180 RepID=A0A0B1T698_OESDE|nr:hypothetical protein OESDEN_07345 [Oesophagostomum dentatum]